MTQKNEWLRAVRDYPVSFGISAGYDKLTDLHNEWIRAFIRKRKDQTLQAHRGSYKTTCVMVALALMIIVYPDEALLFMRKTEADVKEVIRGVKNLLQTPMYQDLCVALYGRKLQLTIDSSSVVDTNLKIGPRGTPQLTGVGINGNLTGQHYDIICTDDIITLQDRISRAEREHTKIIYQELQNIKNKGGRFINTGTPWHKDDAFLLMGDVKRYDCYSTGLISKDDLNKIRQSMGPSLFSANYELRHISVEEQMFTSPKFFDGWAVKIYDGIAHIDASYGGADYTAFTILKPQKDGTFLVFGKLWSKHVDDVLPMILAYHREYRAGTIWTEKNADKGYLNRSIREMGLPAKNYSESMNKYVKIATYLRANWDKVIFMEGTDREYIDQILEYTENAEHDDAPDSLACLLRRVTKGARYL